MSRRNTPAKRRVAPDKKYNNLHITMFVNRMMRGGKRSIALSIMYRSLAIIEEKMKRDPIEIFEHALRNVTPSVEVKPMRVGGSTYQVPVEVPYARATSLAMRWILETSRGRGGKNMAERLSSELLDAFNNQGASIKKKDDTHRMAEANRAFAHFR
jgi:small subunit ribosomal protein S7